MDQRSHTHTREQTAESSFNHVQLVSKRENTAVASSSLPWDYIAAMTQNFSLTQRDKIPLDAEQIKMQWDST